MGFNFPNSPTTGQLYPQPPIAGLPVYQWDGQKWTVPSSITPAPTKNYIINGAMLVSQENGGAASTVNGYFPVDQFSLAYNAITGTVQAQNVASRTPSGSPNRIRITCTVADTAMTTNKYVIIIQNLEGVHTTDLMAGLSTAKSVIFSFGVKAPAGTYCLSLRNAALNRSYVGEFTVASGEANTDVYKTIALTLDTTGTWASDNTVGIYIVWSLMMGPTYQTPAGVWTAGDFLASSNQFNFMGTVNNVFELFDVGLYQGSVAPLFQVKDYADELQSCLRYFEQCQAMWNGQVVATGSYYVTVYYRQKRAAPTITSVQQTNGPTNGYFGTRALASTAGLNYCYWGGVASTTANAAGFGDTINVNAR